ncbi:hypothetical protein K7X08_024226 [Anisodus acutangulus]|uniref:Uncharacterized protein n=1 Tax=Anisodus acutangulus TaxID=402998 RepID=A0A9Q1M8F7_9SOLA|nr:hypothetical protein K7X08_024226 [Anisodus acutangulus]
MRYHIWVILKKIVELLPHWMSLTRRKIWFTLFVFLKKMKQIVTKTGWFTILLFFGTEAEAVETSTTPSTPNDLKGSSKIGFWSPINYSRFWNVIFFASYDLGKRLLDSNIVLDNIGCEESSCVSRFANQRSSSSPFSGVTSSRGFYWIIVE